MRVRVFDTTLRDGEQSPGVMVRPQGKLEIARKLDRMGVDAIEAGFPVVSKGELEGARMIAEAGLRAEVCGLARANRRDVDAVAEAGMDYAHIFIATSDIHLEKKLRMTREEALGKAVDAVSYAKSKGMQVEFSAEDATRTEMEFLKRVYRAVEGAGADRINIPDTVGCMMPEGMASVTAEIAGAVSIPVSVHCHNDAGLATANTIAAVRAGAKCVHVTVNGVGERAGNASLEEVAAIFAKFDTSGKYETGIDLAQVFGASQMVSGIFGMYVQRNKAIVGENAFTHEAGIHAHGVMADPRTYQHLDPRDFARETRIAMGKHSGAHGVKAMLEIKKIDVEEEKVHAIVDRIKARSESGVYVTDGEFVRIVREVTGGAGGAGPALRR